jgi:hypothetical protein
LLAWDVAFAIELPPAATSGFAEASSSPPSPLHLLLPDFDPARSARLAPPEFLTALVAL